MFNKKFRVKSNSAIKGSDRRKLKSQVSQQFGQLSDEDVGLLIPNKEEMSVLKLYTHSGVSIIVYCLGKNPLFFEQEKQLYPTVYTLWKFPNMVPYFTTWPPVLEKLRGGADLMLPGVVAIGSLPTVNKGEVCGINLVGSQAAVAVGVAHWSTDDMQASGMRGKGVLTLHTYGDHLWEYGEKSSPPQIPMEVDNIPVQVNETGDIVETTNTQADNIESTETEGTGTSAQNIQTKAGGMHPLPESPPAAAGNNGTSSFVADVEGATQNCDTAMNQLSLEESEEIEESTEEKLAKMDALLMQCFLFSLKYIKKSDLPLLASTFYAQHIQKCCPGNKSLDIKKTSYKKLSKFLQSMKEQGLVEMKEFSKGVSSIVGLDKSHDDLRNFVVPEDFARTRTDAEASIKNEKQEEATNAYQAPQVIEMFGVTSTMVPIFQPQYKKGSWLVRSMVKEVVTEYVKENSLVDVNDSGTVTLDPHLSDAVINKGEYITHLKWDLLFTRFYEKMQGGYQVLFPGDMVGSKAVKKGKIQPITISVVQKAGNKKVTLVHNLEIFQIDPKQFAHEIQVGVATSTSVSSLPGKNAGLQVMVQGNQINYIASILIDRYGLARKYISGLEKAPKGKRR